MMRDHHKQLDERKRPIYAPHSRIEYRGADRADLVKLLRAR